MIRKFLTLIILTAVAITASANIDSAKSAYAAGDYAKAVSILEPLVKKTPKDAAANYYLGAALYRMGKLQEAVAPLKVAEAANWPIAAQDLAEINLKVYNLDAASDHLERWSQILTKTKKPEPVELDLLRDRVLMARNMFDRVENITLIDKIVVDSVQFFTNYMLSSDAGELLDASILPDEYAVSNPKVVYQPQSGKELFWADNRTGIVVANILDDGTVTEPHSIGDEINGAEETDFPFVMDDGVTIYYAAKGEDSLGGYDIFMTRRSPEGDLLQPQNVGMPYNSPYNDFMMVIDNTRNIGWFASDREHIPGKVTIYAFVPSEMRVNYNPESEGLSKHALLQDVALTGDLDVRCQKDAPAPLEEPEFFLPMSNGKVYTSLGQFKNPQARQAMNELLKRMFDLDVLDAELDELRSEYAKGDKRNAQQILSLERKSKDAQVEIDRLTNQIISLETRK